MANNPKYVVFLAIKALEKTERRTNFLGDKIADLFLEVDEDGCPTRESAVKWIEDSQSFLNGLNEAKLYVETLQLAGVTIEIIISTLKLVVDLMGVTPAHPFVANKFAQLLIKLDKKVNDEDNALESALNIIRKVTLLITTSLTLVESFRKAAEKKIIACDITDIPTVLIPSTGTGITPADVFKPGGEYPSEQPIMFRMFRHFKYEAYINAARYVFNSPLSSDQQKEGWADRLKLNMDWHSHYPWGGDGKKAQVLSFHHICTNDQIEVDYANQQVLLHATSLDAKYSFTRVNGTTTNGLRWKKGSIFTPAVDAGTVSAEIKMPGGLNLWSAYWLRDSTGKDGNSAGNLEIDMFECYTGTGSYERGSIYPSIYAGHTNAPITSTYIYQYLDSDGELKQGTDANYADEYQPGNGNIYLGETGSINLDPTDIFVEWSVVRDDSKITIWTAYDMPDGTRKEDLVHTYEDDGTGAYPITDQLNALYFNTGIDFSAANNRTFSNGTTSPMVIRNVQYHESRAHVPPSQQPRYDTPINVAGNKSINNFQVGNYNSRSYKRWTFVVRQVASFDVNTNFKVGDAYINNFLTHQTDLIENELNDEKIFTILEALVENKATLGEQELIS